MGTLIDSSLLIAAERQAPDLGSALAERADQPVALAAISASELLEAVRHAATPAQRRQREALVERLLAVLPVLPFDLVTARIHASLQASLAAEGESASAHDLLIGATAIAAGYCLATRDRRTFGQIPGLELIVL